MSERLRDLLVGVTSIVALVGLATLLMFFGELDALLEDRYPVTILLDDAGGLYGGSQVTLDGVRIGVIDVVRVRDDPVHRVRAVALILADVRIPADAEVKVDRALIGGGATLVLSTPELQPGETRQFLPTDGQAVLTGEYRTLVQEISAELDERMKPLIEGLENFRTLSETYVTLGENLNDLVRPQDPGAIESGEAPNIRTAVAKLNTVLDDARGALALANEWLGDEQLRADARSAVQKAGVLIESATTAVDRYAQLADSIDADMTDLTQRLAGVIDEMGMTLEQVHTLVTTATTGRGTLAMLLNNPDLYNSLTDAALRLERTLVEAQLLLQKIQAEGLPVNF